MTMQLGRTQITVVSDGTFRLDGGTMFGIVPKAIWSKLMPPDEQNRIELGLNSLLVRSPAGLTLVEAGIGRDYAPKKKDIYAIDERTNLLVELDKLGVKPADINRVILTHLHFDHSGWCTRETGGRWTPTFPNARHVVQAAQWRDAHQPSELSRGGYLTDRLAPLNEQGLLQLVEGETDLGDGIAVIPTPAHARGHQSVKVCADGETIFYPGDIIPTVCHLRLPYIMAYDRDPDGVVNLKAGIIREALEGRWIICFSHDPHVPLARLEALSEGGVKAVPIRL